MTKLKYACAVIWFGCALLPVSMLAAEERVAPESALRWQPREYPEATLHARVPFLHPQRDWERLDVWVPKSPAEGKLPCVVAIFGGGFGDKSPGFINDVRPLLKRGFVVAAPDYALQTDAPVPLCAWDVANAIRFLRAHAGDYRIDPERIGVWGWSAGGWIAQDLCYAGPQRIVNAPAKVDGQKVPRWFPMLQPHPQFADQSVRVQAVVSDWGAEKLWNKKTMNPQPWLSPDDPPLFTCYNDAYRDDLRNPVMLLRQQEVPARAVYAVQGNTHVPKLSTSAVHEDGRKTTWGESIYQFFEDELKRADTATAPEMIPHGGAIAGPTQVRLLTCHPASEIHFTLDGSTPSAQSPRYESPIHVRPEQTLRAIVIRNGLKPSRVTTGVFTDGPEQPVITTREPVVDATVGEPVRVVFRADHAEDARWFVGGKTGEQYREFAGVRFNPSRHVPWISIDAKTGVLSGVPRSVGTFPVIVSCMATPSAEKQDPETGDAVLVVVRVKDKP